eukprot:scaffold65937_cov67-Phaeocystis_antarctica.AAC.2
MRGAHGEHGAHARDAGRVEAQRLVELVRGLSSRKQDVRCGARCGPGVGGHGPAAAHKRHAWREGPVVKAGGAIGHVRGAHVEHGAHARDAGRVEVERLVERRRVLPSRKEGVRCGARCGPGVGGHGPAAAHKRHAPGEGPVVKAGGAIGHARSARRTCSSCP